MTPTFIYRILNPFLCSSFELSLCSSSSFHNLYIFQSFYLVGFTSLCTSFNHFSINPLSLIFFLLFLHPTFVHELLFFSLLPYPDLWFSSSPFLNPFPFFCLHPPPKNISVLTATPHSHTGLLLTHHLDEQADTNTGDSSVIQLWCVCACSVAVISEVVAPSGGHSISLLSSLPHSVQYVRQASGRPVRCQKL